MRGHAFVLMLLFCSMGMAQTPQRSSASAMRDREEVLATIKKLFDAMRAGDSKTVAAVFDSTARLQTTFVNYEGKADMMSQPIAEFAKAVGAPHPQVWDERIWSYDIKVDGNLASAWTEYSFYLGEKLSHCGVNAFQLFRTSLGWKIIQLTDTRNMVDCPSDPKKDINAMLDDWHHAAATADETKFFGSMSANAIYIGTDATERWTRDELRKWSKEFFDRDSAWVFKPINRYIHLSDNSEMAWFEEHLNTWMGVCRGSGVLLKTSEGWRLQQYVLSVAVPNDVMKDYVEILKKVTAPAIKPNNTSPPAGGDKH